jgi:large subunit ribosomal protein L23
VANPLNVGDLIEVIKYPLITEKSTKLNEKNFYTFIVDKKVTKETIKQAVEYLFSVKVLEVKTLNLPPKKRRVGRYIGYRPNYKKTIVKLDSNNRINFFPKS